MDIGGSHFILKINNCFYMKAKCIINYKLLFTEFEKKILRYGHVCKRIPIQTYGAQFFWLQTIKNSLKLISFY